ncbi:hypothetical protein [Gordonia hydrophobica]|uniref:Transmembrane protein n=1 Tax=Gordonia hydrophobica TaxID=40516 RepID=A0ABZ2TVP2_9ACTN|nr:hypothetical protein [Gordonia hydrophobica]MBM7365992.1 hypothetical protein [Gordonia hydrophobica]
MAKDSEPRARPITVSELIARSEGSGAAFPKSASEEDRRTLRRAGASGMPAHPPVTTDEDDDGADANVVTGIIPVVSSEPTDAAATDATETLEPVPADDLVGVDLPPLEYRSAPSSVVDSDVTATDALPVIDDEPVDAVPADDDSQDDDAPDEPTTEHRHVASAAELEAANEAEDAAEADAKAQAAEKKAAKKAAKQKRDESEPRGKSALLGWLGLIGEVVLGLAVGAGLFWGFTELWKRYVYLALILAVVVIFAIVTFAHVLRKRDLPTTLMALGVGMLVTIGPLVLLAA